MTKAIQTATTLFTQRFDSIKPHVQLKLQPYVLSVLGQNGLTDLAKDHGVVKQLGDKYVINPSFSIGQFVSAATPFLSRTESEMTPEQQKLVTTLNVAYERFEAMELATKETQFGLLDSNVFDEILKSLSEDATKLGLEKEILIEQDGNIRFNPQLNLRELSNIVSNSQDVKLKEQGVLESLYKSTETVINPSPKRDVENPEVQLLKGLEKSNGREI